MQLPVMPPVAPMLAKAVPVIPDVGHVEPKWDGFRTIVFLGAPAAHSPGSVPCPVTFPRDAGILYRLRPACH